MSRVSLFSNENVAIHSWRLVRVVSVVVLSLAIGMFWAASSIAQNRSGAKVLKVQGTEFDPQHICDAEATWVRGIGLFAPDDSFASGFLMHKLCATTTNAAAFGLISGATGQTLIGEALGFDYKNVNGGFLAHCGSGAPRFNVSMSDGSFHFIGGCANGTKTPETPATGWTRVRFDAQSGSQAFPFVPLNATIVNISLAYDEGSDTPGFDCSPEIVLDNIFINGRFVTRQ